MSDENTQTTENEPIDTVEDEIETEPESSDADDEVGAEPLAPVANEMDMGTMDAAPSALSGAATGQGYSREIISVLSLAQYIRNLGYEAVPSMNDTGLAIPYAIKAGLGEYGRNQLLISPEFGPRLRISKSGRRHSPDRMGHSGFTSETVKA